MFAVLRTMGIVLRRSWPELLAAYVAGAAAHHLLIQLAGLVAASSQFASLFVQPLPVLARLISYVAMILVVRDSLPVLSRISPRTFTSASERRITFINAVLMSVLPFFAFYYAAGFLKEDNIAIMRIATRIQTDAIAQAALDETLVDGATPYAEAEITLSIWVFVVVGVAFALRQLGKKFDKQLPTWTRLISVYLEVVWVFMTVMVLRIVLDAVSTWIETRQGLSWFFGIGDWFAANLPALASAWEFLLSLLGALAGLVATPLAWLTIVGVIYGQAIAAQPVVLRVGAFTRARSRYATVNADVREGIDLAVDKVVGTARSRLQSIAKAFTLMFRAGPLIIGTYIALFALWNLGDGWLDVAFTRIFGPLDPQMLAMASPVAAALAGIIMEPLRSALVSSTYDAALANTIEQSIGQVATEAPGTSGEDTTPTAGAETSGGHVLSATWTDASPKRANRTDSSP